MSALLRTTFIGAAIAASTLFATTASAAPWKPSTREARKLMDEGKAAYERGDHLAAAALFEQAWKKEQALLAAFNAAQSYRLAGEYKRAIGFYDLILADSALTATEREDVQRRRQITEWWLLAETASAEGRHADARDYYRRLLDVRELSPVDRDKALHAIEELARAEHAAAPAPVNTTVAPMQPPTQPQPAMGDTAPSRWTDMVAVGLLGTGVVGFGVGTAFLVHAGRLDEQASVEMVQSRKQDLADRANSAQTIGLVGLVVGGGLIVAGAIKLAIPPDAPRTSVSFQPTSGGAVFVVGGAF